MVVEFQAVVVIQPIIQTIVVLVAVGLYQGDAVFQVIILAIVAVAVEVVVAVFQVVVGSEKPFIGKRTLPQ